MRILSTRVHGMIDYGFGILLVLTPYLFGFANGGAAQYLPQALGVAIIAMSLVTDYELSLVRLIPMPAHLGVDMLGGVLLAASPWLFGFSDRVYWPHLILGIIEIGAAAMTEPRSAARDLTARHA